MARLWAPWRMAYIKDAGKDSACFLCSLPKSKKDRENLILYRGKTCFVILNKFPYNNGHLLVSPYRHVGEIEEMTDAESLELMKLTGRAKKAIQRAMNPNGFNLGVNLGRAAGAGLPGHVHMHLVPRWNGDCNFMPVLGETKVLPLTLLETWDMLHPFLK
ncbi:MAG: HIT domain-containing protein [Planctomycetes bacterium]|nr:HIT domain-containing protein [Planctomycetota bacterium]